MRSSLKALGLGRAAYYIWHRPRALVRESLRAGGPVEQWRTARGRSAMRAAARELPLLEQRNGAPLELHVFTGRNFWEQTAFCLWTFARHSGCAITPVIYCDGTLTRELQSHLARLFPAARFVAQAEIRARLDTHLPANRFPFLRERWERYPNIRKLTDPHLGASGWKLIVDSDLLFFRRPQHVIDWLAGPRNPLHAIDSETSYGYPRSIMDALAGTPVAERVNVGLCGLASHELDWAQIEYWCRSLIERHGTHYYLEQALVALLVAGRDCTIVPAADYVTLPQPPEAHACQAVMHHYVATSKRWYFRDNWRRAIVLAP